MEQEGANINMNVLYHHRTRILWYWPMTWLCAACLLAVWPLGRWLPLSWGVENSPIEWAQVYILGAGFFVSCAAAKYGISDLASRRLWGWLAPCWLLMLGREMNWGRVLYPIMAADGSVSFPPKQELWFGAYINPGIAVVALTVIGGIWYYGLYRDIIRWIRYSRLPRIDIGIFVVSVIVSIAMERECLGSLDMRYELYEELAETTAYLTLISLAAAAGFCRDAQPKHRRAELHHYERIQ